jgi:transportin-1
MLLRAERIAECAAGILIFGGRLTRTILENSAITLGRVAMICPEQVAPHLSHFCAQWCGALRNIRDDKEKEDAFFGLCNVIRLNPDPAMRCFAAVAAAVVSWRRVQCEGLMNSLAQVVQVRA